MFYEYAITPEVFDPEYLAADAARGVILTQLLRGLCDNGMIADLHKGAWGRKIREKISALSEAQTRADLQTLLSILKDRNRVVRHPKAAQDPKTDLDWLGLACEANGRAALDAIILSCGLHATSARCDDVLSPFDTVLAAPHWQRRRHSITIKQCEADYCALLSPILRHAKRLYLIDPYLRPDLKRFTDTIILCGKLLGERGGSPTNALPGIIEIHTSAVCEHRDPLRTVQEEAKQWNHWICNELKAACSRHTVRVSIWARDEGGERFHDRFLITDQIGFSVAGGLDCVKAPFGTPSDTVWTLLNEQDRQAWLQKFQPGTSPYRKVYP